MSVPTIFEWSCFPASEWLMVGSSMTYRDSLMKVGDETTGVVFSSSTVSRPVVGVSVLLVPRCYTDHVFDLLDRSRTTARDGASHRRDTLQIPSDWESPPPSKGPDDTGKASREVLISEPGTVALVG